MSARKVQNRRKHNNDDPLETEYKSLREFVYKGRPPPQFEIAVHLRRPPFHRPALTLIPRKLFGGSPDPDDVSPAMAFISDPNHLCEQLKSFGWANSAAFLQQQDETSTSSPHVGAGKVASKCPDEEVEEFAEEPEEPQKPAMSVFGPKGSMAPVEEEDRQELLDQQMKSIIQVLEQREKRNQQTGHNGGDKSGTAQSTPTKPPRGVVSSSGRIKKPHGFARAISVMCQPKLLPSRSARDVKKMSMDEDMTVMCSTCHCMIAVANVESHSRKCFCDPHGAALTDRSGGALVRQYNAQLKRLGEGVEKADTQGKLRTVCRVCEEAEKVTESNIMSVARTKEMLATVGQAQRSLVPGSAAFLALARICYFLDVRA